jgi:DNA-binding MarR family transcriptional regulator
MKDSGAKLPSLPCLCASLRRAARGVTQLYEEALRPLGLRAGQFTILQALATSGEVLQGELGRMLVMDSTTLTRTLDILERHGWIAKRQGKDKRERRVSLTREGEAQLGRALPHWEKAQQRFRDRLGAERWDELRNLTNEVTNAVME